MLLDRREGTIGILQNVFVIKVCIRTKIDCHILNLHRHELPVLVELIGSVRQNSRLTDVCSLHPVSLRGAVVPLNAEGALLAGGAGSTVAGGAGSIVAGGAGSSVAGGAGSTVAGGAGSTVAGGAGSIVAGETGSTVAGETGSSVAGGAGSIVAGGAGSTVAGGAGSSFTCRDECTDDGSDRGRCVFLDEVRRFLPVTHEDDGGRGEFHLPVQVNQRGGEHLEDEPLYILFREGPLCSALSDQSFTPQPAVEPVSTFCRGFPVRCRDLTGERIVKSSARLHRGVTRAEDEGVERRKSVFCGHILIYKIRREKCQGLKTLQLAG